mgnify:CR=1 FL=1
MEWYCLSSFNAAETVTLLRRAGYIAYCPHERVTRRRGRKTQDVERPVCPGYAFIHCDLSELGAARIVGKAHDFVRYTADDGTRIPVRLARNALVPFVLAEAFGALDFTDKTPPAYRPAKGERVKLTSGKFSGYFARIMAVSKNRAKLEMEKGGRMSAEIRALEAA